MSNQRADRIKVLYPLLSIEPVKFSQGKQKEVFLIKATILNNNADTLSVARMACNWQAFYQTDSRGWYVKGEVCYRNAYFIVKIPPFRSIDDTLKLIPKESFDQWQPTKIRIGFKFLRNWPAIKSNNPISWVEKIIWSNPIVLNVLLRDH
jgi:hypothetical protein